MTTVTTSGTVTIAKDNKLSGTVTVYEDATEVASIDASGTAPTDNRSYDAGTDNGWTLDVTYNGNTASASVFNGAGLSSGVSVVVDKPGKPRRRPRPRKKPSTAAGRSSARKRKPAGRRAKAKTKTGTKRSASRRKRGRR